MSDGGGDVATSQTENMDSKVSELAADAQRITIDDAEPTTSAKSEALEGKPGKSVKMADSVNVIDGATR